MIHDHDCGCITRWDDESNHPMYLTACAIHRRQVPDGWLMKPKSRTRQPIKSAA